MRRISCSHSCAVELHFFGSSACTAAAAKTRATRVAWAIREIIEKTWVLWPKTNVVDREDAWFTNQKRSDEFRVRKEVSAQNEIHRTRPRRGNPRVSSASAA